MRFVEHHNHDGTPVVFCSGCGYSRPERTIEELIEASSLGTPEAKAMRASVSDERARAVVERARQLSEEDC